MEIPSKRGNLYYAGSIMGYKCSVKTIRCARLPSTNMSIRNLTRISARENPSSPAAVTTSKFWCMHYINKYMQHVRHGGTYGCRVMARDRYCSVQEKSQDTFRAFPSTNKIYLEDQNNHIYSNYIHPLLVLLSLCRHNCGISCWCWSIEFVLAKFSYFLLIAAKIKI